MEFNFDNINCGPASTPGSGVVAASTLLSLPSYSILSQELLHLQQQQQQQQHSAVLQVHQQQQQTPQLIFSTNSHPHPQLQQCLQLQSQPELQLQLQNSSDSSLIHVQVQHDHGHGHHELHQHEHNQHDHDQHQQEQLESQLPNFGEYALSDFMNGTSSDDGHDHNNDELPEESMSLLLMPPQSPTVIKTELDKIEETIKEVGSGGYFQEQQVRQPPPLLVPKVEGHGHRDGHMQNGHGHGHEMPECLQNSFVTTVPLVNNLNPACAPGPAVSQQHPPQSQPPPPPIQLQALHKLQLPTTNSIKSEPASTKTNTHTNTNTVTATKSCASSSNSSGASGGSTTATANTNGTSSSVSNSNSTAANHIGSRNSAFLPYKPITVLTNLQRGNVKTLNKEVTLQRLTIHEKAARGDLTLEDLNGLDNIDTVDTKGRTMLHWAAFHSKLQSVQILVDKGADVNFCTPRGETPLMYASANGHVEIINYLLTKAANLEVEDENGNTPIFYATLANHAPSISALLKSGASLTKPNCNGDSPFNIAISRNLSAAQYAMENYLRDFLETNYVIKSENLQSN